jgi:hypothetical protein
VDFAEDIGIDDRGRKECLGRAAAELQPFDDRAEPRSAFGVALTRRMQRESGIVDDL